MPCTSLALTGFLVSAIELYLILSRRNVQNENCYRRIFSRSVEKITIWIETLKIVGKLQSLNIYLRSQYDFDANNKQI